MNDVSQNNLSKKPIRRISISKKPKIESEEMILDNIGQEESISIPERAPQLNQEQYDDALTMESNVVEDDNGSYDVEEFSHFGDSDFDETENPENYDYEDCDDSDDYNQDGEEYEEYDDSDDQYDDSDSEEDESEEYYDDDDLNDDIPDGEYTAIYDDSNDDDDDADFLNSFDEDGSDYNDGDDEDQSFEVEDFDENDETEDDVVEEEVVSEPIRQPVQVQTFKSDIAKSPKRQIRIQQNNRPNNTANVRSDKINKLVNSRSSMNVDDVPDSPRLNFEKPQKEEYQDISSTSNGNPYSIAFNKTTNDDQIKQNGNPQPQQQQQPINRSFIRQQQQQPQPQQFQQPAPAPQQVRQPVINQPVQQQQAQPQKAAFDNRSNFDYPSQTTQHKEKDFLDTINSIFDRFKFFFFIGGFSILCLLIIIMGLLK